MTENSVFHDKLKHIEIRYHYIQDMVHKGVIPAPIAGRNPCYRTGDHTRSIPQDPWAKLFILKFLKFLPQFFRNFMLNLSQIIVYVHLQLLLSLLKANPIPFGHITSYYWPFCGLHITQLCKNGRTEFLKIHLCSGSFSAQIVDPLVNVVQLGEKGLFSKWVFNHLR